MSVRTCVPKNIDGDNLLEKIILEEGGESVSTIKTKTNQGQIVLNSIEKLKKETEMIVFPLSNELNVCTVRIDELNDKKTVLLKMLEEIETETTVLKSKKVKIEENISNAELSYERTVSTVAQNPLNRDALLASKMHEKVRNFVSKVSVLENSIFSVLEEREETVNEKILKEKTNGKVGNGKKVVLTVDYPVRVKTSSTYLHDYVRTECQCLCLLAGRVVLLSTQLIHYKRELNAYKSLNMTVLVGELTTTIKKTENDIDEDKKALNLLQDELCGAILRFSKCLNLTDKGTFCFMQLFI